MAVTQEQVEAAIITLLDGHDLWPYECEPQEINEGLCDDFAHVVCSFLGFPDNLKPDCAVDINSNYLHHVWLTLTLEDGGKLYFDSECEYGTDSLDNIPYFQEGR